MNPTSADDGRVTADVIAYVDEAGEKGYLRELSPARDAEIGLMCSLPIPYRHLETVQGRVAPLFSKFKEAAPPGAKLHIAAAFAEGQDAWRVVAEEVRSELFELLIELNFVVLYVARRCSVVRRSFENTRALLEAGKAERRSRVNIVGANRPSDDTLDDDLVTIMGLCLNEFVQAENLSCVDLRFDQIDAPLAERYADRLQETREVSSSQHIVRGWDSETQQRVAGTISMRAEADFCLDTRHLGRIDVVGKDDPLVFAVDVVANTLWRHLQTLPSDAPLNHGPSVEGWALVDLVWGKNEPKNWDFF